MARSENYEVLRTFNPSCCCPPLQLNFGVGYLGSSLARFNVHATNWCAGYALEAGMSPTLALRSVEEDGTAI